MKLVKFFLRLLRTPPAELKGTSSPFTDDGQSSMRDCGIAKKAKPSRFEERLSMHQYITHTKTFRNPITNERTTFPAGVNSSLFFLHTTRNSVGIDYFFFTSEPLQEIPLGHLRLYDSRSHTTVPPV